MFPKTLLFLAALFILVFWGGVIWISPAAQTTPQWVFYDRNQEILYSEKAYYQPTPPEDYKKIKAMLIAREDQRFYTHGGVDFWALGRALRDNWRQQKTVSGASTLTMQLARMLYLENESHNLWYKIRQILYAFQLEYTFSKEAILQQYLDRVYLGQGAYGFASASKRYFSKPIKSLSTDEIALLIGILPRPDTWNPIKHPEKAQAQRDQVLKQLENQGILSVEESTFYQSEPIQLNPTESEFIHAPHFVQWVKKQLAGHLKSDESLLQVYTTLDRTLYQQTLETIREKIDQSLEDKNLSNMAVVSTHLDSNELVLMLGGEDFFNQTRDGEVNMATASRALGSTLKPFLFAYALEHDYTPLDTLEDKEQSFLSTEGSYMPKNFDPHKEYGSVHLREALTGSYNIAAVALLEKVGVTAFHDFLTSLNLSVHQDPEKVGLSLILGTGESSLLELTNAYTIFPKQGTYIPFQFFTTVKNEAGHELLNWKTYAPEEPIKALSLESAEWITHALSDQESRWNIFSRGNPLEFEFDVAAKTGTSQDFRDNYVVGYSSQYLTGVWAGNTDGTPMHTSSGIEGAGPIWHTVMRLLNDEDVPPFAYQSDRQETLICRAPWEEYPQCTEVMTEFLLPEESTSMRQIPFKKPRLEIAFPGEGDRFHPDSSLSIKVRNVADLGAVHYFFDGEETGVIIPHLEPGRHRIEVEQGGERDRIEIVVEEPNR